MPATGRRRSTDTLTGSRDLFGRERTTPGIMMLVGGDTREHLGRSTAYARTNRIVPPWSRCVRTR